MSSALVRAAGSVPATARAAILETMGADDVETKVTKALDRSTRQAATDMTVPGSILWPMVGFLQLILGAVLLLAVAWYLIALFGPGDLPVATIEVPYLGPMPTPLVLLAGSLALSLLLGFLLTSHAAWIGRRIGLDAAARVREAVAGSVATVGFSGLDTVEEARRRLASLADPFRDGSPRRRP